MAQIVPAENLAAKIRTSNDIGQLKDIKDKAEALRTYFRQVENGFKKQNEYAEVKIRAERRCGEILAAWVQHGGDQKTESRFKRKTLKDLGISKNQSHRWQTIAQLTEEAFEGHLTKIKESYEGLTSAGVYRIANEYRRTLKAEAEPIPGAESIKTPISIRTITADFMDCIDRFENIDAIITDQPYPIKHLHLYENLARFASQVLKPGGSLLTMAGVCYLPQVFELMTPHLNYHWTISYHMLRRPRQEYQKKIFNTWKPILWFVKDKYEGKWNKDALEAGGIEKTFHPWQQTSSDFEAFIELVSQPGETIIDPLLGSGTLGESAIKLNREFVGIEIEPNTMQTAEKRLEGAAKETVLPSFYSEKEYEEHSPVPQAPKKKVIIHENKGNALRPQNKIDSHNLPFTLNTTIGCHFGCSYCYLQGYPFNRHTNFGQEVKVKTWIPEKLDKELYKYRNLPQHLKRVQVNPATEGYLPYVMTKLKKDLNRDIMLEVLKVFRKHWEQGNCWIVHLLTKSHMVRKHLDVIADMKDQVQLELTITTLDENRKKLLEGLAPSVKKRLDLIKEFSKAGVFVRVMAMPCIGNRNDAEKIKRKTFDHGARGFKHKSLNYFDEEKLLKGELVRTHGRKDEVFEDLLEKSSEPIQEKGDDKKMIVKMPVIIKPEKTKIKPGKTKIKPGKTKKWRGYKDEDFQDKEMVMENSGYKSINKIDWGYVV